MAPSITGTEYIPGNKLLKSESDVESFGTHSLRPPSASWNQSFEHEFDENTDNIYFGSSSADYKEGSSQLSDPASSTNGNSTGGSEIVVRGEEIGIIIVVLLLWIGAIILFFNRWGKIRMLEPYQPKFCENHRLSCPMADVTANSHCPRSHSKFNLSVEGSPHFAKCNYHGVGGTNGIGGLGIGASYLATGIVATSRPRQNSVFVTSPHSSIAINSSVFKNASRKTKSAIDLSTLVLSEEFLENVRRNSKNSITHL